MAGHTVLKAVWTSSDDVMNVFNKLKDIFFIHQQLDLSLINAAEENGVFTFSPYNFFCNGFDEEAWIALLNTYVSLFDSEQLQAVFFVLRTPTQNAFSTSNEDECDR